MNYERKWSTKAKELEVEGAFKLEIHKPDHLGRGRSYHMWHDRKRQAYRIGISNIFNIIIRKFAVDHNCTGPM